MLRWYWHVVYCQTPFLINPSSFYGLLYNVRWNSILFCMIFHLWIRLSPSEGTCRHICIWRTANRNTLSLRWPVIGWSLTSQATFSKARRQSQEEVQRPSVLSDQLIYNMLKGYYGIFAQSCKKTAYPSFNALIILCTSALTNQKNILMLDLSLCSNLNKMLFLLTLC